MTTAHRPTWKSAFGLGDNLNKGYTPTRSYSARVNIYLYLIGHAWLFTTKIAPMGSRISRLIKIKGLQIIITKKISIGKVEKDRSIIIIIIIKNIIQKRHKNNKITNIIIID
jgi:hypothetical protein